MNNSLQHSIACSSHNTGRWVFTAPLPALCVPPLFNNHDASSYQEVTLLTRYLGRAQLSTC